MQDLLGQRNRKQTKIYDPHSGTGRQEDQDGLDGGRAAAKTKRVRLVSLLSHHSPAGKIL